MTWTAIVVFKRGRLWEPGICPSAKGRLAWQCFSVLAKKHFLLIKGANNVNSVRGNDLQTYRFSCNSQLAKTLDLGHGLRSVRGNQSTTPKQKDMLEQLFYEIYYDADSRRVENSGEPRRFLKVWKAKTVGRDHLQENEKLITWFRQ